ncbi:MAG: DUF547 domain-containing protein [Planctomycetes bacterium]|nr:DUF547 domain-containing protein [Planctomycetota bacterium]
MNSDPLAGANSRIAASGSDLRRSLERRRPWGQAAVLLVLALGGCTTTLRSPLQLDPAHVAGLTRFDAAPWALVLAKHVNSEGRVDYPSLLAERAPLDRFVALIETVGPRSRPELFPSRDARLAYYLNAYNAFVVFNVLERWPLTSVYDDALDFFVLTKFPLDGRELSLKELEDEVVRPFGDPRVHFALNCASVGCPRLPQQPFAAEELQAQLTQETARFLGDPRNVSHSPRRIRLSEIFSWYEDDFAPDAVRWIAQAAPDLALPIEAEVEFAPYDWRLNRQ